MGIKQETPPTYSLPNTQQTAPPPQQLSQNVINQLITGIQQASKTGNTDLPSRDIPVDTARIVQDEEVKPNFVPEPENDNYIHNSEGPDDMPAHIKSALTQTNLSIPIENFQMTLGTWQEIYLFEHRKSNHTRTIKLHLIG